MSGTKPTAAGSAATRKSISRTWTLPQARQNPEYRAGIAAVTAALAAPLTVASVITSRIASDTTR